ncbi:hypothetical protein [Nonomuraea salmonea]|uniref:Uncharacterized protein n=1 Tax=Nonomuraea salmonea TaxID=46181 RepID=A0ABV5P2M8_9ACTN
MPNTPLVATLDRHGQFRVHAATCADAADPYRQHTDPFPVQARTRRDIAAELSHDLIEEGSLTIDEALDYVDFLPCCNPLLLDEPETAARR